MHKASDITTRPADQAGGHIGLSAPPRPAHYLRRERLLRLMSEASNDPIVLVVAGAGTGKTTLVRGWAEESIAPVSWVTLSQRDWSATDFWTLVVKALRELVPDVADRPLSRLRAGDDVADVVAELVDELASGSAVFRECFLIIDDLQWVDGNDAISASLRFFVQYLPSGLHILLLSRHEPDLPRDRLLGAGRLVEIHFSELRFSLQESRELLAELSSTLTARQIDSIAEAADGWAASLQMAAVTAMIKNRREDGDVTLDTDVVMRDFVMADVLGTERADLVNFMFDLATVRRANGGLAEALTGRPDALDLLACAERRGLFLHRVTADGWFELHPQMRAALLAERRSRSPDHVGELHLRAARWLQSAGLTADALDHWLLGDSPADALRLLADEQDRLYCDGAETVIRATVARLDDRTLTGGLGSMIDLSWCHALVDRRRFTDLAEQVTWLAGETGATDLESLRAATIGSIAALVGGRWTEAARIARAAIREAPDTSIHDPVGRYGLSVIASEIAFAERWDDSADEVRQLALATGHDRCSRLVFEATRALGNAIAGSPHNALRLSSDLRAAAYVDRMTSMDATIGMTEAIAHWELGHRDRAVAEFRILHELTSEPTVIFRVLAGLYLMQFYLDRGQLEVARKMLIKTERITQTEALGGDVRDWLARGSFKAALAASNTIAARQVADSISDPFWRAVDLARVDIAESRMAAARTALREAVARCVRHEVVVAVEQYRAADTAANATKYANQAVTRAAEAGMVYTVATQAALVEAAERGAARMPLSWLSELRRAGTLTPAEAGSGSEPLTERERDVLRFVPSRLTAREIADELHISINTLKFHLKTIYRKLGVRSRSEAAEVARRMGQSISVS